MSALSRVSETLNSISFGKFLRIFHFFASNLLKFLLLCQLYLFRLAECVSHPLTSIFVGPRRVPTLLWLSSSPSPPSSSPPVSKPISIKTSIFSWSQHQIKHIIHRRKGDSARVHLVMTETKTKTHTKTNTKTKTRTFKSKSSCI